MERKSLLKWTGLSALLGIGTGRGAVASSVDVPQSREDQIELVRKRLEGRLPGIRIDNDIRVRMEGAAMGSDSTLYWAYPAPLLDSVERVESCCRLIYGTVRGCQATFFAGKVREVFPEAVVIWEDFSGNDFRSVFMFAKTMESPRCAVSEEVIDEYGIEWVIKHFLTKRFLKET